jgi:hypothetical protein
MEAINFETPTHHLVSRVVSLFWSTSSMAISSWAACSHHPQELGRMNIEVLQVKWKKKKIEAGCWNTCLSLISMLSFPFRSL